MISFEEFSGFFVDESYIRLECGLAEAEFYKLYSSRPDQHLVIS